MASANAQINKSLWPKFQTRGIGPAAILRVQANLLKEETDGLIRGWVSPLTTEYSSESEVISESIIHMFFIRVPSLDDYLFKLFSIRQESDAHYPLSINPDEDVFQEIIGDLKMIDGVFQQGNSIKVDNETSFLEVLGKIFKSNRTIELVQNLLAQIE